MATARSPRGHLIVVVLVGLTALGHAALAVVPSARPAWTLVLSGVLAVAAAALVGLGALSARARFGGDGEDAWLVACAVVGFVGVASVLVLALVSFSGGRGDVDGWTLGPLLVDALTVRLAVFTLRRVPAGR